MSPTALLELPEVTCCPVCQANWIESTTMGGNLVSGVDPNEHRCHGCGYCWKQTRHFFRGPIAP